MKLQWNSSRSRVEIFAVLLIICSSGLTPAGTAAVSIQSDQQPLRAVRRTPFGQVSLEAFRIGSDADHRPIWTTFGHVSLARVSGRVFRPDNGGGGGEGGGEGGSFTAELLLGSGVDARALANAAAFGSGAAVSECQFTPLKLANVRCEARTHLAQQVGDSGLEFTANGSADSFPADAATALVRFTYPPFADKAWNAAVLNELESHGEVICKLRSAADHGASISRIVHLRAREALVPTEGLLTPWQRACHPPSHAAAAAAAMSIELLAAYNFRSEWRAEENLAAPGRYRVTVRGLAAFNDEEGAVLPGHSWLEVDTEGGLLTEHMHYGGQWSVFFAFKRSQEVPPGRWLNRRAALFSVHRAGNPLASSILAWTTGPGQSAVYTRVHNPALGFADGKATIGGGGGSGSGRPSLDNRPGAWNHVGIAYDVGRLTVVINGAEATARTRYRFPSYSSSIPGSLRSALSIGMVRSPGHAMHGAFRCFGVTRGALKPSEFRGLFENYCQ